MFVCPLPGHYTCKWEGWSKSFELWISSLTFLGKCYRLLQQTLISVLGELRVICLFTLPDTTAAAEFVYHKNIHVNINVNDRRAARKEYSIMLAAHDN